MKKRLQGVAIGILISALLVAGVIFAKSGSETIEVIYDNISIYLDGVKIDPKDANGETVEPFIYNGTTYLPVRAIGEAIGKKVSWDDATKSVYLGENTNTSPENTSTFELSQTQMDLLVEYSRIIPDCTEETISTEEYAKEFLFYYYTEKVNGNEYNDNYWIRAVWEKSIVENDYQTVFGKPLPKMTLQSSGGEPVIYKDGHYHIGRSNSGETTYTYSGLETGDNSYFAIVDISYPDMPERGVVGKKTVEIVPANNSVGFIVKSVKTEYYNR